ncbi:MAG TPA: hypothetical protein VMT85_23060 [Thermoanaerobaculia bacterium]|nr:hypothetical protein [Thermoanaerobaculia bacterium]
MSYAHRYAELARELRDGIEGAVNVYTDEKPGREHVDRARAALSAEDVARATEAGRRLTIKEALDLTRSPELASA